jgi:uncharacterized Zn finger protein (UPF0148 family)
MSYNRNGNGNGINNANFNNNTRGYSSRHSDYDNAFNMDFEYSYLDLMNNFGVLVSRTHDMYSNIERCISNMIETQNERRRYITRRRERLRNSRDTLHQQLQQQPVASDNDNANDNDNDNNSISEHSRGFNYMVNDESEQEIDAIERNTTLDNVSISGAATRSATTASRGMQETTARSGTAARNETTARRNIFDIGSLFYSIPRTVLLNPTTDNTLLNRRRNGGLTISEIEEHTEIITYGAIPSNEVINTECPITRETFTPESVVLSLKHCKHCFVPFRMMRWLETHSTCPLCRENVVHVQASQANDSTNTQTTNNSNNSENRESSSNTNDADNRNTAENVTISNIFNTLLENRSNDFNNLSIDNVNDNSIMFSFDLPLNRENLQNSNSNSSQNIIPRIERLMNSSISRNNFNNTTYTPEDTHDVSGNDDDTNYPEYD